MNNVQLANIIRLLCKSKKITVKNLLENCKINRNFMYDLEKKAQAPSADKLVAIADYLDCSIDYLLGRTDNPEINHSLKTPEGDKKNAYTYNTDAVSPVSMVAEEPSVYKTSKEISILGKVAAGVPILSYEIDYGTVIPENPSASYALIAQGDSMYPVILDTEAIEVISQKTLEQGEIGIISVDGNVTCKKFYNFPDHYELRPINPEFEIIYVPKSSSTNLQIRGKVSLTEVQKKRF